VAPSEQGDDQAQGQPLSADIFISYSRKDIAFARLIRASLQASGLDTWIDWDRIPVGERWWDEICQAIERTHIFMFIISGSSMGSPVCRDEINQALKNHKRIIPILVDHLAPVAAWSSRATSPWIGTWRARASSSIWGSPGMPTIGSRRTVSPAEPRS